MFHKNSMMGCSACVKERRCPAGGEAGRASRCAGCLPIGQHYLMTLPARTIADIYKECWKVEIFFRFIKQNLKIKSSLQRSHKLTLFCSRKLTPWLRKEWLVASHATASHGKNFLSLKLHHLL